MRLRSGRHNVGPSGCKSAVQVQAMSRGRVAYGKFLRTATRTAFIFVMSIIVLMILAALADVSLGLGWGYSLGELFGLAGLVAFGLLVYRFVKFIFRRTRFDEP